MDDSTGEFEDDYLLLSPDHVKRIDDFREEIRLCENDVGRCDLCVRAERRGE